MARQKIADIDSQLQAWLANTGTLKSIVRCRFFADPVYLDKGGRSWTRRYTRPGTGGKKESTMSLGSVTQTFAEVEAASKKMTTLLDQGVDLALEKARVQQAQVAEQINARNRLITFQQAAEEFIALREDGWSQGHTDEFNTSLKTYVFPRIGNTPVADVSRDDVFQILGAIWHRIPETANRIRGRIESVLDFSRARGWRTTENPAAWRGHLKFVLPDPKKLQPVARHHAALGWRETPDFMALLRTRSGAGTNALMFAILTAARTKEVRLAVWPEFDLVNRLWIVPAQRMKNRAEHRIPLSSSAMELLDDAAALRQDPAYNAYVFPGQLPRAPLGESTLMAVLKRLDRTDLTVHGFRSSFRDWCGETGQPHDLAEAALAHSRGKTHGAYQRGDLLERRRQLMAAWADFCLPDQQPTDKEMKEEPFGR